MNLFHHKIFKSKMGRKALVDYSLIREICDKLRSKKKKFKGKLDLGTENGPNTTSKKSSKEIRRLLVTKAFEKASKNRKAKKRKRSPARFTQNQKDCEDTEFCSDSDASSCSSESPSSPINSDNELEKSESDNGGESDFATDANTEA